MRKKIRGEEKGGGGAEFLFRDPFHREPRRDGVDARRQRRERERETERLKKRCSRRGRIQRVSSQGVFARRLRSSRKSRGFIGSKAILLARHLHPSRQVLRKPTNDADNTPPFRGGCCEEGVGGRKPSGSFILTIYPAPR